MIERTDLKRKLRDLFSDEAQPIEQVTDYDTVTAAEILVPFSQQKFFAEAAKEEGRYIRMATMKRAGRRALVFMYAAFIVALMLYNAFTNMAQMTRNGKDADVGTMLVRQDSDPRSVSARQKRDVILQSADADIAAHNAKIVMYVQRGEQSRVTHWLQKRSEAQNKKVRAIAEHDSVAALVKIEADRSVSVESDEAAHAFLSFALPLLVFLCSMGAERLRGFMRICFFVSMFTLMLPNAFLISDSFFYKFPTPEFVAPLLGKTSPIACAMFFVIMIGEPCAYYICSRQIRRLLASWPRMLEHVVEERNARVALRNQIRADLKERELAVIEVAQAVMAQHGQMNAALAEIARARVQDTRQVAIEREQAAQEVHRTKEQTGDALLIPRAETSTELANIIIDMEEAGTLATLQERGITQAEMARQNEINPATLRAEIFRIRAQRRSKKASSNTVQDKPAIVDAEAAEEVEILES